MPARLWEVPDSGGMHYLYVPGLTANHTSRPLVYEPEFKTRRRLVLQTTGEIVTMRSDEITDTLKRSS